MSELPQATSRRERRERELQMAKARPTRLSASASRTRLPSPARTTTAPPAHATRSRHHIASKLLSLGAMVFVLALAVGTSVPANAFSAAAGTAKSSIAVAAAGERAAASTSGGSGSSRAAGEAQTASVTGDTPADGTGRDDFQVLSWAQVLAQQYSHAGDAVGGSSRGSVRWPFPYAVTISSPFGPRVAPCSGCTSFHEGVDFTPGENAAIFAVAGGIVTGRDDASTGYGNYVIITSKIKGHIVRFTYAHMTHGSSPIVLGQTVNVGDYIGLVGQTGEATGPHLHFEVNVDGTTIDPIPWLEANVN